MGSTQLYTTTKTPTVTWSITWLITWLASTANSNTFTMHLLGTFWCELWKNSRVSFIIHPLGSAVGTFKKYPTHTQWVHAGYFVSEPTMNPAFTHWVNRGLLPVKSINKKIYKMDRWRELQIYGIVVWVLEQLLPICFTKWVSTVASKAVSSSHSSYSLLPSLVTCANTMLQLDTSSQDTTSNGLCQQSHSWNFGHLSTLRALKYIKVPQSSPGFADDWKGCIRKITINCFLTWPLPTFPLLIVEPLQWFFSLDPWAMQWRTLAYTPWVMGNYLPWGMGRTPP